MSYNQIKLCMCVEFFWMELAPLFAWLYLLFWDMGYLSFFSHAFGHGYLPSFFLHSPYLFAWWIWRVMSKWCSIFVWMRGIFLRNCFQCRSQRMSSRVRESKKNQQQWARKLISRISSNGNNMRSVRYLDLKSMKWISQGSQTIWQCLMQKRVAYVLGF